VQAGAGRLGAVAAAAALALLVAGCGGASTGSGAPTTTTAKATTTTTTGPAGSWSKAIPMAPGADLSVVSCPAAGVCLAGSTAGQTFELFYDKVTPLGPPVPAPSPQGASFLACATPGFCAAAPNLNQVAFYNGMGWQAPTTIAAAQGFTAVACTGPSFCITIDGEGNSFNYDGRSWSGNLGAWGAANQISCVTPAFCVAAEGGPSVWDGHTWTQPNDADAAGQLNSVSCATTSFCVLVDSNGGALTWNGQGFSPPASISARRCSRPPGYWSRTSPRAAPSRRHTTLSALRATCVSTCPTLQPSSRLGARACSSLRPSSAASSARWAATHPSTHGRGGPVGWSGSPAATSALLTWVESTTVRRACPPSRRG